MSLGALLLAAPLDGCRSKPERTGSSSAASDPGPRLSCGDLECRRFETASEALSSLLVNKPRVVAFGESHALNDAEPVLTATERFGAELLPLLRERGAAALVVELVNPPQGCEAEKAAVTAVQKPVVERQDAGNQTRFVELGHRAKALGVEPFLLEPSCDDFAGVQRAGQDGIAALLELITSQTRDKLRRFHARLPPEKMVVAYGGAIHNDVASPEERKPFAFGADLTTATRDRYLAVDLIVPEFVGDTEVWRSLAWYPYWASISGHSSGVVLIRTGTHEYTLILERGRRRTLPARTSTVE